MIRCHRCGKKTPYAGDICPWCHSDKRGSKGGAVLSFLGAAIGAFVAWKWYGLDLVPIMCGMVVGAIPGALFYAAWNG